MPTIRHEYLTYEEELEGLRRLCGLAVPITTAGPAVFLKGLTGWARTNARSSGWAICLPDPSFNLSFPFAHDELAMAIASLPATRGELVVGELAEQFRIPHSVLSRPVNTLSGGEQMLVSLCKTSIRAVAATRLCLTSPFFWLDIDHQICVDEVLDGASTRGIAAHLQSLSGEGPELKGALEGTFASVSVPVQIRLKNLRVDLEATTVDGTEAKTSLCFRSGSDAISFESPLLIRGKNGAGKTTFAKLLSGVLRPTEGSVRVVSGGLGGSARLVLQDTVAQLFCQSVPEHLARVFGFDQERRSEAKRIFEDLRTTCGQALSTVHPGTTFGDSEWPSTMLECKLALIAARLTARNPLLVLDEPGWCLSRPVARALVSSTAKVAADRGVGVALISHQSSWWSGIVRDELSLARIADGAVEITRNTLIPKAVGV